MSQVERDSAAEFRAKLDSLVARGRLSAAEAEEAITFFDRTAEKELRGELTPEEAIRLVVEFGLGQLRRRQVS